MIPKADNERAPQIYKDPVGHEYILPVNPQNQSSTSWILWFHWAPNHIWYFISHPCWKSQLLTMGKGEFAPCLKATTLGEKELFHYYNIVSTSVITLSGCRKSFTDFARSRSTRGGLSSLATQLPAGFKYSPYFPQISFSNPDTKSNYSTKMTQLPEYLQKLHVQSQVQMQPFPDQLITTFI